MDEIERRLAALRQSHAPPAPDSAPLEHRMQSLVEPKQTAPLHELQARFAGLTDQQPPIVAQPADVAGKRVALGSTPSQAPSYSVPAKPATAADAEDELFEELYAEAMLGKKLVGPPAAACPSLTSLTSLPIAPKGQASSGVASKTAQVDAALASWCKDAPSSHHDIDWGAVAPGDEIELLMQEALAEARLAPLPASTASSGKSAELPPIPEPITSFHLSGASRLAATVEMKHAKQVKQQQRRRQQRRGGLDSNDDDSEDSDSDYSDSESSHSDSDDSYRGGY